jgi:hypothetical protein
VHRLGDGVALATDGVEDGSDERRHEQCCDQRNEAEGSGRAPCGVSEADREGQR